MAPSLGYVPQIIDVSEPCIAPSSSEVKPSLPMFGKDALYKYRQVGIPLCIDVRETRRAGYEVLSISKSDVVQTSLISKTYTLVDELSEYLNGSIE